MDRRASGDLLVAMNERLNAAQRTLLSAADSRAASEGEVVSDVIRLYKALGGGWDPEEPGAEGT